MGHGVVPDGGVLIKLLSLGADYSGRLARMGKQREKH
jgi:hypothetical protein